MLRDENSVVVPDKKKKGFQYRLATLELLWENFLAQEVADCSYAQFTRWIPDKVVKPKPEYWGTSLCMTCLNPEIKLSALKKVMPEMNIDINNVHEKKNTRSNRRDFPNQLRNVRGRELGMRTPWPSHIRRRSERTSPC